MLPASWISTACYVGMSVRMSPASWGREVDSILHIHGYARSPEHGFSGIFLYFLPDCLDGKEFDKVHDRMGLLLSTQRPNEECVLRPWRMVLQCSVQDALECEIRMLGYHVNLRVGQDCCVRIIFGH